MTHRADSVNILKFLIWSLAVRVFGAVSNLIISFPLSLRAEKYGSQENNPERATSIFCVLVRPGPLTAGLCYGALLAVLLSLSTLHGYSDHWLSQSLVAVAFVANSAHQNYVHARAWMLTRVTGGKLCAEIYRSEWLGALTALAAINLPLG
jgi:hypothetical protein